MMSSQTVGLQPYINKVKIKESNNKFAKNNTYGSPKIEAKTLRIKSLSQININRDD